MRSIGVECLCVFGLPPVAFVQLAADLGCGSIGSTITAHRYYRPETYPDWSLRDPVVRRETAAALRDTGVELGLFEGFVVKRGLDVRDYAGDLDILSELGGRRLNAIGLTRDPALAFEGFAKLAEMAGERGQEVVIEIGPGPCASMVGALEAVRHVGRPNFKLLIDTMHFFRLGGTIDEVAAIDPSLIGYVQLNDVPRVPTIPDYIEEAMHERMVPGAGELPLVEFLALVPEETIISVEVPQRSLVERGESPHERVGRCVQAARALVDEAQRPRVD